MKKFIALYMLFAVGIAVSSEKSKAKEVGSEQSVCLLPDSSSVQVYNDYRTRHTASSSRYESILVDGVDDEEERCACCVACKNLVCTDSSLICAFTACSFGLLAFVGMIIFLASTNGL